MIVHDTWVRVRYAETDQMGYVYYGKYTEYFEVGRVETLRAIGISYKEVEERGIMMPVANLSIQYKTPGRYDDNLKVRTIIPELPSASFLTRYEVFNPEEKLVATGEVRLAFIDMQKMRPVRVPDFILDAVKKKWESE